MGRAGELGDGSGRTVESVDGAQPGRSEVPSDISTEPENENGVRRGRMRRDVSVSAVVAGFVAVLVSYAGPFVVVLAAAHAAGLSTAQTSSWVWAISIGSGLTALGLSLWTRQPVITTSSRPPGRLFW